MWNKSRAMTVGMVVIILTVVLVFVVVILFKMGSAQNIPREEFEGDQNASDPKYVEETLAGLSPEESITTEQFVVMVLEKCRGWIEPDEETWSSGYFAYALKQGLIEDYDITNKYQPIERRAAARIAHEILLKEYRESDESDWQSAEVLEDLYDCHTCVNHIAQMYAKGIMTARSANRFDDRGTLTCKEARELTERLADKKKRVIPSPIEQGEAVNITPEEAFQMPQAIFIDVRTSEEYGEGHIKDSINIPLDKIKQNPYAVSEKRDIPIILYCVKGYKSEMASEVLIEAGYRNVYILPGVEQYQYELVTEE